MYYLRWGQTQSGPYESHQILQMAEHGMVTELYEVVDSITRHSMTVGNFRTHMQQGMLPQNLYFTGISHEQQQRLHIEQLQKQHDEIEQLKSANQSYAQRIDSLSRSLWQIQGQVQQHMQLQQQPPAWVTAQMKLMQEHLAEIRQLRAANERIAEQLKSAMSMKRVALPDRPLAYTNAEVQEPEARSRMPVAKKSKAMVMDVPYVPVVPVSLLVAARTQGPQEPQPSMAEIFRRSLSSRQRHFPGMGIFAERPSTWVPQTTKNRMLYQVLALFLGMLGLHNLYAQRYGTAAIQLFLTVTCGWAVVPFYLMFLYNLGEIFIVYTDGDGNLMA